MTGAEFKEKREALGYSVEELKREIGRSKATIYAWESSPTVPRLVELALIALETVPDCHRIAGEKVPAKDAREFAKGSL
jgi:transcriptional regulator with XRE-family HTH domain